MYSTLKRMFIFKINRNQTKFHYISGVILKSEENISSFTENIYCPLIFFNLWKYIKNAVCFPLPNVIN